MFQVSSQTSSVSSCDDYIIVLPDCFDTSRPLDKSTYVSATLLPDGDTPTAVSCVKMGIVLKSEEAEWTSEAEKDQDMQERAGDTWAPNVTPTISRRSSTVNHMPCASQTLDTVTLTPKVVPPTGAPLPTETLVSPPALYSPRLGSQHG